MSRTNPILIKNINVFLEEEILINGFILMEDSKITGVYSTEPTGLPRQTQIMNGMNLNAIPGFIDGHIHGANGADMMDAREETLDKIATALPQEGTTSFLATTITQSTDNIEKALKNVANYESKMSHAEVIGIHLEGPYVEKSKAGAQPLQYIIKPDLEQFQKWQALSGSKIKTVTLAPEHDEEGELISYLAVSGINVSAGHTNVGFEGMKKAVREGVRQLTHLCNAMNGIHHRDIGAVGAAFELKELRAELIADGIHVSPDMLQLIYNNVGSERLILITDSMRAKGLPAGQYELGGQPVKVTDEWAVLEDETLAGSILKMDDGARQMLQLDGVEIKNIIEMTAMNPAKQIGVYDRKGSISVGKDADILLVDDELNIKYTFCRGIIAYEGE
ncbi:N-acetylglucosamine-6-phosphate deacetylase [Oceanobacillus senegalensis]|uniref:N-acetylglucosamine-6-phosphate deacetylase n=1 Tax=Oceanobacillus senegalensis TaxID=1936063 RepID=UPI001FE75EBE|nr:N-acetylglucosamine-6-phosphate deacetylase [Oceanobacillus senegalensis]